MYYTLVVSLVSVPCCLPRAGDDPGNFLLSVGDYEFINEIKLPKKIRNVHCISKHNFSTVTANKQPNKLTYSEVPRSFKCY